MVEPSSSVPTIQAGQLIRTPDSVITASGSVAGNIVIAAPNTDISSSLVVFPERIAIFCFIAGAAIKMGKG